jgi:predicted esterase
MTVEAGTFKDVTLSERSPLSSIEESFRRMPRQFTGQKHQTFSEMTAQERASLDYDLSRESVDVVVPASAQNRSPHGLFVWMGLTQPDPEWFGALARHRLIYVAPNRCDGRSPWVKRGLAIDAVHNLRTRYSIDPARVYLSGFSAGAHQSAKLVAQFPDVFRGAVCLMGGRYYLTNDPTTSGRGIVQEPTVLGPEWYGEVGRLKKELRLVSVFGASDDVVPAGYGRADHEALRLDGFQHTYIELAGHGHKHPDLATFQRALAALASVAARPAMTGPIRGNERPHPDQVAQAKRLLTTARMVYEQVSTISARGAWTTKLAAEDPTYDPAVARRCLTELLANYPTAPAAVEGRVILAKLDTLPQKGRRLGRPRRGQRCGRRGEAAMW